ncbi:MAG: HNH endonuclease signature motif containing protein [Microscillaceae bacterium]|nr:HNH endonuclease signature motif containing protein [Microscillaceae bacterium]
MANLDEKTLKVWDKAIIVEKIIVEGKEIEIDTERYRQDICNAWIEKDAYGDTEHPFGWEKDHTLPDAKGGTDHLDNLRPMHTKNNRGKGDEFPSYTAVITSEGNKNKTISESKTVNDKVLERLKQLYPNNLYLRNI